MGQTFRSLRHRNYRLYFFGQAISLIGNWIQSIAMGWLVFRLTNSALLLGVVGFAGQIPSLLITPFAGVYADKVDRRKVLVTTQAISMMIALALSFLILTNRIQVIYIIIAAVLNGCTIAIDTPFRHSFIINLVEDKNDLPNAIALNSTLFNSARFIGPPIGGFLIAIAGEGICFLINGLSYIAVIASLLAMYVKAYDIPQKTTSIFSDLINGIKYAYNTSHLRILIIMVITTSFMGLPFQVFMPVFAKEILGGDSQTLGFLTGALGAGALIGALILATQTTIKKIPDIILISATMFSIGLLAFTNSTNLFLSLFTLAITGFGMIVILASCNTLLQTAINEDMRGRIVSLYSVAFMGFTPIGSLLSGAVAEVIGLQYTLSIAAVLCLLSAFWYYKHLSKIKKVVANYYK